MFYNCSPPDLNVLIYLYICYLEMNRIFIKGMYSMIILHMDTELADDLLCLHSVSLTASCRSLLHTSPFPMSTCVCLIGYGTIRQSLLDSPAEDSDPTSPGPPLANSYSNRGRAKVFYLWLQTDSLCCSPSKDTQLLRHCNCHGHALWQVLSCFTFFLSPSSMIFPP